MITLFVKAKRGCAKFSSLESPLEISIEKFKSEYVAVSFDCPCPQKILMITMVLRDFLGDFALFSYSSVFVEIHLNLYEKFIKINSKANEDRK